MSPILLKLHPVSLDHLEVNQWYFMSSSILYVRQGIYWNEVGGLTWSLMGIHSCYKVRIFTLVKFVASDNKAPRLG